jgi:hypothetical protein
MHSGAADHSAADGGREFWVNCFKSGRVSSRWYWSTFLPIARLPNAWALMSISLNDQWRAHAIARMDRDPFVFDELCSIFPDWPAILDDLVEADRKRPLKKSS